ncbi:MAG: division/cell wall cluster transcriptional repressor MraZ [Anaerolineae bacterium]|nr:division/cell wall cluster transcriptional repressor MraZ [Anaerolineae bacterium]
MFLGHYVHAIDDKGRLTLPAKFRPGLEAGVVVTLGLDGCLFVFPRATWEALAARIEALPITNPDARTFARLMFANADDMELDRQGRILIPAFLRSYAKLETDVIVTGLHSRIELWNPTQWQALQATALERSALIAEHLKELGI